MRERAGSIVCLVGQRHADGMSELHAELARTGFAVRWAEECEAAAAADSEAADAFVLVCDAGCDDDASIAAIRLLRSRGFEGPILVLARRLESSHAVAVLESGADDYIRPPHDPAEVAVRLRTLTERVSGLTWLDPGQGDAVLDRWRRVVRSSGGETMLTPREAALLECLARPSGRSVPRDEIATRVWGTRPAAAGGSSTNLVDVYISYLRRKLAAVGQPVVICAVRGVGYKLVGKQSPVAQ